MKSALNINGKTTAAFLYVVLKLGKDKSDMHSVFKALYFADKKHLSEYGRMITDEKYIAMKDGPVPSSIYDGCKDSREKGTSFQDLFKIDGRMNIQALKEPDMEEFSESDIECMNTAIAEVKKMNFNVRREISHDSAYDNAWYKKQNSRIDIIDMARAGGAHTEIIQYLSENIG
jgi:uncharacterized phage-associated protein